MCFKKHKSCKIYFANHDFKEIKSRRKANHILNTSIKLMHIGKLMAPRKSTAIVFVFYDLLRMIWLMP